MLAFSSKHIAANVGVDSSLWGVWRLEEERVQYQASKNVILSISNVYASLRTFVDVLYLITGGPL